MNKKVKYLWTSPQYHKSSTANKEQIDYFKVLWVCKEIWFLWWILIEFRNPNSLFPVL